MAETTFTHDVGAQDVTPVSETQTAGRAINILGAVASLALVAGVGVWGYKLVMRDVSGVPVVRVVDGPMRVQPENPGGRQADHQGLAVNTVAAKGSAAAPADRLMLAPRPVELAEEDTPMSGIAPVAAQPEAADPQPRSPLAETTPTRSELPSKESLVAFQNGAVDQLVDDLTAGIAPLNGEEDDKTTEVKTTEVKAIEVATAITQPEPVPPVLIEPEPEVQAQPAVFTGPGLRRSLRPHKRPVRSEESYIDAAVKSVVSADIDPENLPAGTRLAQLGAYESAEVARSEWVRLSAKFGDYLEGKSRVIQKANSGGRTFYRLRAMGFDDISDARRFCSALVAENADCIPVTIR